MYNRFTDHFLMVMTVDNFEMISFALFNLVKPDYALKEMDIYIIADLTAGQTI